MNIAMKENGEIRKAKEELEYLTGDKEERRLTELRKKAIRDEVTNINCAKKENSIEIAKKLKQMNMKIEDIQKATGLTEEEIKKL